jgi:glycosyltransferase involved in cell wall biosynthesis
VGGLRIVYLNPVGVLGGAERSLLDVMASLRKAAPAARLHLITATDGPLLEVAGNLGVDATVLPMPGALVAMGDSAWTGRSGLRSVLGLAHRGAVGAWTAWRYAQQVRAAIDRLQPDLIHSNGIKFHLLTRLAKLHKRPVLWHIRDFLTWRPLMARALKWASSSIRGAIAISHAVAADARTILRHVPVAVVHNAVDTDYFSPGTADGRRLDELAGLPLAERDTIRVGLLATFARWKGHEIFLEAAARFIRTSSALQVRFYIIGGPIYHTKGSQLSKAELRAKAAELGIEPHVGFIDFQSDTAAIYRALDIVVHASTRPEPFGRTIVEAMACSKPVIVAQAGGAAEIITHDHDAVAVRPGEADALAAAISRLAVDSDLRQRLAVQARNTAVRRFARERLGVEILALYQQHLRSADFGPLTLSTNPPEIRIPTPQRIQVDTIT